jgi:hypothetical protein
MDRRQKLVAGLTIAAVVLMVGGLAAIAVGSGFYAGPPASGTLAAGSPSSLPTPVRSPSAPSARPGQTEVVPTASPSPTRSPTPRPAGYAYRGTSLVYYTGDGTVVPVPIPAGLRVSVASGRAVYYAGSGNRYGLALGSYAGEFRPDVTMQQADGSSAQTGGVVVVGAVASRLIADKLASYETASDRWIVALPVDIRTAGPHVDVTFDGFGLHGWSDTPRVVVRYVGSLPVTNVIPSNTGYHVLVEGLGITAWQVIDPLRLSLSASKLDPAHLMNELLIYGSGAASTKRDVLVDRRAAVGQEMLSASDEVSVSLVIRGSRADLGPDRVLQVGDVPVFVASS